LSRSHRETVAAPSRAGAGLASLCAVACLALGCAQTPRAGADGAVDPLRYRLSHSGTHWDVRESDRVFDDVRPRYPDFFDLILDPSKTHEPNLRELREDLEHRPVDRRNFDALNAVAIAYFEINYRAETQRGGSGFGYLSLSFRSAQLLGVPWRAYGEVQAPRLRDAILDFFEDAASGEKLGSAATAGRLIDITASLQHKEEDPERLQRIRRMTAEMEARWGERD
jgi:hypothetical protein